MNSKLIKLASRFEKNAQYTGAYELSRGNVVREVLKAAPELQAAKQYVSVAMGQDFGDSFEVIVTVPYVEHQVKARIEMQLHSAFNDPRFDDYPIVDFKVEYLK